MTLMVHCVASVLEVHTLTAVEMACMQERVRVYIRKHCALALDIGQTHGRCVTGLTHSEWTFVHCVWMGFFELPGSQHSV
jgi:hypothetical protein